MANDCLLTKLKGSVNNDNLPIYGKLVIDLNKIPSATPGESWLYIKTGPSGVPVTLINTELDINPGQTEVTIGPNQGIGVHFDLSRDNARAILGNVYEIRELIFSAAETKAVYGGESLGFGNLVYLQNNIPLPNKAILKNCTTLIGYNDNFISDLSAEELADVIQRNPNLRVLQGIASGLTAPLSVQRNWKDVFPLGGNLANFPTTLCRLYVPGGNIMLTGSLTDFVNNMKAAGRTSGKIIMSWPFTDYITIEENGEEVTTRVYCTNHNIPNTSDGTALVWDANGYSLTTDTTGAEAIPSIYNIQDF